MGDTRCDVCEMAERATRRAVWAIHQGSRDEGDWIINGPARHPGMRPEQRRHFGAAVCWFAARLVAPYVIPDRDPRPVQMPYVPPGEWCEREDLCVALVAAAANDDKQGAMHAYYGAAADVAQETCTRLLNTAAKYLTDTGGTPA